MSLRRWAPLRWRRLFAMSKRRAARRWAAFDQAANIRPRLPGREIKRLGGLMIEATRTMVAISWREADWVPRWQRVPSDRDIAPREPA